MTIIKQDITTITSGVIVHQVNCMNRIGGGLSGHIIRKWPIVEQMYHSACNNAQSTSLFKTWQPVRINDDLAIINCFTQYGYGNPTKTRKKYTDEDALIQALKDICGKYPDRKVYIPYGIGCGLGGADWNEIVPRIFHLPLFVAKLQ